MAVFGAVVSVVLITYGLMAAGRGELLPGPGHVSLVDGIGFQLWQRDSGGSLLDAGSLNRLTLDGWLDHDPVLPVLAAPVALAGLFVRRLRPFAFGLAVLIVMVVRPGYLPVPLVVTALPMIALLIGGLGERLAQLMLRPRESRWPSKRLVAAALIAVAVLTASMTASMWQPSIRTLAVVDVDAPLRQAQEWIAQNVPKSDRLIVDDAVWVDLVHDGRDRRDVVWAYKLDSDPEVRAWAPHGWQDYDWVVSTASLRANIPTAGVLVDALAAARPVAIFEPFGERVEVLRIEKRGRDPDAGRPSRIGSLLAARLAGTATPAALDALESGTVDERVLASLAVVAATEPISLVDIPPLDGEANAAVPRRELRLAADSAAARRLARYFGSQTGMFAAQSVKVSGDQVVVQFPLQNNGIRFAVPPTPTGGGTAELRVSDLRIVPSGEQLNLVRLDGTGVGSVPMTGGVMPSDYRTVPVGTYVATTQSTGSPPIALGLMTVDTGRAYTLAVTSAPHGTAAELVPDGVDPGADELGSVRLIAGASSERLASVSVADVETGDRTVLADGVRYGLITGYAQLPGVRTKLR